MPGGQGVGYTPAKNTQDMRYLEYEKFLLLKTAAIFQVPPEEIGFTEHLPRASAQVQHDVAFETGLSPMLMVFKEFFDKIIQEDLGYKDLEFRWITGKKEDEAKQADIADKMIKSGVWSVDEVRQKQGLAPIGLGNYIMTGSGPILVKDIVSGVPTQPANQKLLDLERWERKVLNKGVGAKFESKAIPSELKIMIEEELKKAQTKPQIKAIFEREIKRAKQDTILKKALMLKEDIEKTLKEYD